MGGFGGMDELAVLCALFSCTLILMTHEDDPDHVHLKGLMAIYKPSAAARAQLGGNPSPFGTAEVAIFHVDAFEALQYLSSDERPTTILLELKNNHVCGFLGPAAERPLSCISQASLKPLQQTRDSNLTLKFSPLREVHSNVKELQVEGSSACLADMAARQAGLAGAKAELKHARKEVRRLNKGKSAAASSRKRTRRSGKKTEATQAVDSSMSVLIAQDYVWKWKKLRDQDWCLRPWPVHRRDAKERPGASRAAAASSESESDSSDARGDGGDAADDSDEGADASKKRGTGGKLPAGKKKKPRMVPPKQRFPQERTEQQHGALVPTRIAEAKVFAMQYEMTTRCLAAAADKGWQYKLNGDGADTMLAHGESTAKSLVWQLAQEREAAMSLLGWGVLFACYNFFALRCMIFEPKTSDAWPLPADRAFSVEGRSQKGHNSAAEAAFRFAKGCIAHLYKEQACDDCLKQEHIHKAKFEQMAACLRHYATRTAVDRAGFLHLDLKRPDLRRALVPLAPCDAAGFCDDKQACALMANCQLFLHRTDAIEVGDIWVALSYAACLLEAMFFAIGATRNSPLGLVLCAEFQKLPAEYHSIVEMQRLFAACRALPFELHVADAVGTWFDLFRQRCGIFTVLCAVRSFRVAGGMTDRTTHAVAYDAWRGLLYIGGGRSDEKWLCGFILVEQCDRDDPSALIAHLAETLHLGDLSTAYRLFVQRKQAKHTSFNTPKLLSQIQKDSRCSL